MPHENAPQEQRIDKWLWAARFFKTRSSATAAVSGGKVHVDGDRVKPARRVRAGTEVEIRRGVVQWDLVIRALCNQRRPAKEAALLYEETEQSIQRRAKNAEQRRIAEGQRRQRPGRPDRRARQALLRFKSRSEI